MVAAAYTAVQLALAVPGTGLGWDETVYVSQVSPHAPDAFFSAPRARGITLLVAPVAALTPSVTALRVWLALLSGLGLFLALRVWRRLLPGPVLALGGGLFAGLWVAVFYGPQAMPNLWVAFAALAGAGCFLRAVRDPSDTPALLGLGAAVATAALMRPLDGGWLALPLAAAAVCVPRWRRPAVLAVLAAGLVLGCAPWIWEAYARFGGLLPRLRRASEIQGSLGWHPALDDHVRALGGRTLCRPCEGPWRHEVTAVWFFLLAPLTALGVRAAARTGRLAEALLCAVTGIGLGLPYVLTVDYAAPRFLLPAYLLLALPVALGLYGLRRAVRPALRPAVAVVLALALAGHLAVQYAVLHSVVKRFRADSVALGRIAAELRGQGVRPPCVISGEEAIRIAHRMGCASRQVGGHDAAITPAGLRSAAERSPVAVLVARQQAPPAHARGWRPHPLPDVGRLRGLRGYLSPSAQPPP
ncbi:hypothetical protein [Streptomyces sp. URMC 123]|uniref:hypothetical protein n=1 Tax=Streptomyces sp. URMC 123 TaxID=3423403 RepID=UPI003F1C3B8E